MLPASITAPSGDTIVPRLIRNAWRNNVAFAYEAIISRLNESGQPINDSPIIRLGEEDTPFLTILGNITITDTDSLYGFCREISQLYPHKGILLIAQRLIPEGVRPDIYGGKLYAESATNSGYWVFPMQGFK